MLLKRSSATEVTALNCNKILLLKIKLYEELLSMEICFTDTDELPSFYKFNSRKLKVVWLVHVQQFLLNDQETISGHNSRLSVGVCYVSTILPKPFILEWHASGEGMEFFGKSLFFFPIVIYRPRKDFWRGFRPKNLLECEFFTLSFFLSTWVHLSKESLIFWKEQNISQCVCTAPWGLCAVHTPMNASHSTPQ